MPWMGIAVTLVAGVVILAVSLVKRPVYDLGSVSKRWLAQHRVDGP